MLKCSYVQALKGQSLVPHAIVQETNNLPTCALREPRDVLIRNKHHTSEDIDNTAESRSTYDAYAGALQINWEYAFDRHD